MSSISFRILILILGVVLAGSACDFGDSKTDYVWEVPYPDDSLASVIQQAIEEDSTGAWWTSPLDVIFVFVERSPYRGVLSPEDVKIETESMMSFNATVIFPDDSSTLFLKLRRAFPRKSQSSVLQVAEAKWADD